MENLSVSGGLCFRPSRFPSYKTAAVILLGTIREMGVALGNLILDKLKTDNPDVKHIRLAPELIIRESVKKTGP